MYFHYDIPLSICFVIVRPIKNSIVLVVMVTKVSTPVSSLFWKIIEGIRINSVLVYTILI